MAQIDSYIKRVRMGCNLSFLDDIFENAYRLNAASHNIMRKSGLLDR